MKYELIILGGGESGVGAAILAKKKGIRVFLSDNGMLKDAHREELKQHAIDFEEGAHTEALILSANEIIKSPGIPDTTPLMKKVIEKHIPVISEIEFAARYSRAKTICITGSNGKTTTANLIYHILKSAGLDVGLGGNIGNSFARQIAARQFDYFVLELSSFQLDNMYDFKADIAILLNITPDHLDRYNHEMQRYVDAKMRITRNQSSNDVFIYWADDPIISKEVERLALQAKIYRFATERKENVCAYVHNENINIEINKNQFTMEQELLALEGTHNMYNSMAAGIAAKLLDISDESLRQSLRDFRGVPHRLEKVATVRGVQYVNDSKATNVNSCWYALQSMRSKVVLILGGQDKGNDYSEIESLVKSKVRALIFMGKDNTKLHAFFDNKMDAITDASSMQEAVDKAYALAQKGDTVLLSPCCASFDLFANYEDRGDQFKACVRHL